MTDSLPGEGEGAVYPRPQESAPPPWHPSGSALGVRPSFFPAPAAGKSPGDCVTASDEVAVGGGAVAIGNLDCLRRTSPAAAVAIAAAAALPP